ncbi:efflux RND transporter periplasmic adaptor subunit [Paracoccus sp. SCSIO 75233]|uniref:efflux RND transporter periplasmic adaptor subunit n=1 Tax=Paracoccus sp. SCSIO 75233 TaxID=3017782 RepID=UPI0022F022F0|nr:efflux RND transporter periplasmic adaptor subunit [Paracoccus sp. SCSIO 75233]WBU54730.1 efflux RND transporter periplasmic adaptor subunit [Paracoccus sp. SCSIO 75233]
MPAVAQDAEAEAQAQEVQAQAATVSAARMAPIEIRVPMSGSLVPRQEALVYPQLSGYEIMELLAEPGDQVSRGQVLARLSDLTVRAQLAQAEAEAQRAGAAVGQARSEIDRAEAALVQAAAALERTRRLQRGGTATQAALDQVVANEAAARAASASATDGLAVAEAAKATADAAVEIARLNLARTEITAPVDGIVTDRNAQIGAVGSAAGEPMFTIVAGGEIEWSAEIIETALERLAVDDPAVASVAGLGEVQGVVRRLPAAVDPVTRLGELRVSLEQVPGLRSGLFASGWVVVDRHEGLSVPMAAVLSSGDVEVVQVARDGIIETREVVAGAIWQGRREILSGLEEGEMVVSRAGAFFRDGDRVNAVVEDAEGDDDGAAVADEADAPQESADAGEDGGAMRAVAGAGR